MAQFVAKADPAEWAHWDLWVRVRQRARLGTLSARWIPARRAAEERVARGIPERHCVGTATADDAASGFAAERAAPA
eukprot:1584077-Lingulodinium_polyedra.AAC.1